MADKVFDLIIIGAGAAGLMAAAEGGRLKLKVLALEGQRTPGQKLLLCGGGRCNATHIKVGEKDYQATCVHTLRHVLKNLSPDEVVRFFAEWQAPLVLQDDGCYFSADGHARTVLQALVNAAGAHGSEIRCGALVNAVANEGRIFNVVGDNFLERARALLVTTGGLSYPETGSTGLGYKLAASFGHRLVPTRPALTPFIAATDMFYSLAGIVVDVRLALWLAGRKVHAVTGPLLFTHHGFSGPAALEMSRAWWDARSQNGAVRVDFFSGHKEEGVDFLFFGAGQRSLKNILTARLPERLVVILLREAGVDGLKRPGMAELSRKDRQGLARVLRDLPLPVRDVLGYAKAEITAGGVDLKELKGATLESRLQEGLYFAGEVVDVDGRIGGFNLHWSWASAVSAVRAVAKEAHGRRGQPG